MASQIDNVREFTSTDEDTHGKLQKCPLCKTKSVARGITSTHKDGVVDGKVHCPNCGHTYTWNTLIDGRVDGVHVTSEGDVTTITVDNGTLQLYANIAPFYADNTAVAWTSSNEAVATVDANGLVTALTNGTAVIRATSDADSTHFDELAITTSNQV